MISVLFSWRRNLRKLNFSSIPDQALVTTQKKSQSQCYACEKKSYLSKDCQSKKNAAKGKAKSLLSKGKDTAFDGDSDSASNTSSDPTALVAW
eukprot:c20101_g1_i1 orf=3-278(-)